MNQLCSIVSVGATNLKFHKEAVSLTERYAVTPTETDGLPHIRSVTLRHTHTHEAAVSHLRSVTHCRTYGALRFVITTEIDGLSHLRSVTSFQLTVFRRKYVKN